MGKKITVEPSWAFEMSLRMIEKAAREQNYTRILENVDTMRKCFVFQNDHELQNVEIPCDNSGSEC